MDRPSFQVKLMGVRGSMPVHGAAHARFGGATSCVFIRAGEEGLILDAGSGLNGAAWRNFFPGEHLSLLITHAHADHILGFPAFGPLFDPRCTADIYLKSRAGLDARRQLETLMNPPLWPVGVEAMRAALRFCDVPGRFAIGPVQVSALEGRHPGGATLYRLDRGGESLVYATDFEPDDASADAFCDFAADCSLLLLDGQYTDEEYAARRGFGHSAMMASAELAQRCRARQTLLIHHDPNRTDDQLLLLEQEIRARYGNVRLGREGEEIDL